MGLFKRNRALKHQEVNACDEKMNNQALHINKNWVIGILSILVIVLIAIILSSQLFDDKNVSIIISFTATILSMVLSLLAILYSYLGNIESFNNLSEIRTAVAEIKATEDGIKHFISSLNMSVSKAGSSGPSSKVEDENKTDMALSNTSNPSASDRVSSEVAMSELHEGDNKN